MKQSRIESMIEANMNTFSGFLISYFMWIAIIHISGGKQHVPDPFILTSLFTVTSLIRSYVWRRFFNEGLHTVVHRSVTKICRFIIKYEGKKPQPPGKPPGLKFCGCTGCTNIATHTWSGHPTCDDCATPSRKADRKYHV